MKKIKLNDTFYNATKDSPILRSALINMGFKLMGHYDIKTLDSHIIIRREFTFFKPSYRIEGLNWRLVGNFLARNYSVVLGERPIMNLSKHWFTWGDSYELDIKHSEDALLALCIVICIDYEMQTQANSANSAA